MGDPGGGCRRFQEILCSADKKTATSLPGKDKAEHPGYGLKFQYRGASCYEQKK
jgi:hypothetical protein